MRPSPRHTRCPHPPPDRARASELPPCVAGGALPRANHCLSLHVANYLSDDHNRRHFADARLRIPAQHPLRPTYQPSDLNPPRLNSTGRG